VVATPHISGQSTPDEMASVFPDYLPPFLAGRPLRQVMDRPRGY
jgi:hypothetical protein